MTPSGWKNAKLGGIAKLDWGNTSLTKASYSATGYPAYSASGQDGLIEHFEHEGEGIVLSAIGARCGRCFFANGRWTAIKNTITIFGSEQADIRYLFHFLSRDGVWPISGGAQPFIAQGEARKLQVLLPPLPEQKKIAAILDSADDAILATQAVVDQIRKVKQGLLHQLLTRGIGHTRFKPTEIGTLPESWEVLPGSRLFVLGGGHSPSDILPASDGETLFIKVDDLNHPKNRQFINTSNLRFRASEQIKKISIYPAGTIVFPKRGAAIFKNRVRILSRNATVDPNLMCMSLIGQNVSFFYNLLEYIGLHTISDNSGVPQLNNKHLYPKLFQVPPEAAQNKIADILQSLENALEENICILSTLQANKQGIMDDLLTGRKRVEVSA